MVEVVGKPSSWAEAITFSHCSVLSLSGQINARMSSDIDVEYKINGGVIKEILVDSENLTLIVVIESESDGSITLNLPRISIDSRNSAGTEDIDFIIFIDGAEVPYQENKDAFSRIITFEFEEGDSNIEVIGTTIIPEFGSYVMIALFLSVLVTIIFSYKFKPSLSFITK